jgi:uncharacterized membrane protein
MKTKEFLQRLDETKITEAIATQEARSSGEIRVYVSHRSREDALEAAQRRFDKLGMTRTRRRNGVLIYFAPITQKMAIWGDTAVHEKVGANFWQQIIQQMSERLKQGHFTDAIVEAIHEVGSVLAQHFPREPGDQNELPNTIIRD